VPSRERALRETNELHYGWVGVADGKKIEKYGGQTVLDSGFKGVDVFHYGVE